LAFCGALSGVTAPCTIAPPPAVDQQDGRDDRPGQEVEQCAGARDRRERGDQRGEDEHGAGSGHASRLPVAVHLRGQVEPPLPRVLADWARGVPESFSLALRDPTHDLAHLFGLCGSSCSCRSLGLGALMINMLRITDVAKPDEQEADEQRQA
jgi:hypothetical protein